MRRVLWLTALSLGLCSGSAAAQGFYPGGALPGNRPAYSPYLNLLRRDQPLVSNYYGLVRPEINLRNSIGQLETQQTITGNEQAALQNSLTLPPTGHASRFQTHSKYFLNSGGAGGGAQYGAGAAGPAIQGAAGGAPAKGGRH